MKSRQPRPRPATVRPGRGRDRARSGCGAPLRAPRACRETNWLRLCAALHAVLQRRSGTEPRHLARGDLDPLAGLRVHALTGPTLGDCELAEAGEVDLTPAAQRLLDHGQNGIDGLPGLALTEPARVGYLVDELTLRHGKSSSVAVRTSSHANNACGRPSVRSRILSGFSHRKAAICVLL